MQLEINKISVDKECLFNTLKLVVVIEQKHIELQPIHFKDGIEQGDGLMVYKPKPKRLTLKQKPDKIILIVNPQILNLRTPFQSVYLNQTQDQTLVIQTELGDFMIDYSLQFPQSSTPKTTVNTHKNKKMQSRSITEFRYNDKEFHKCKVCNRSESDNRIKEYKPSVQDVIKENVELKHQLNLLRSQKLSETNTIMRQIEEIEERSKSLVLENVRKKRTELEMRNMIEDERIQMIKKILHLRDMLDNAKKI